MKKVNIQLETLSCPSCIVKIEGALKNVKGVDKASVKVRFNASKVVLHFDEAQTPLTQIEAARSEEHTSELQSRPHLVCRLLLEKKNKKIQNSDATDDKKYRYKPDKIQTTRTTMTADTQSSFTSIYTSINPRQ